MSDSADEVQRTLGRLEGKLDQLLTEQSFVRAELLEHKGEDRNSFSIVSARFGSVAKRLDEADQKRDKLFAEQFSKLDTQDSKLDVLNDYVSRVKGAWWFIGVLIMVIAGAGAAIAWLVSFVHLPHK